MLAKYKIIHTISFIVLFAYLFLCVQWLFLPAWKYIPGAAEGETDKYTSFYQLPENTLDYIVLGTSHSFYSTNPMQIYAETGTTGYDLGSPSQPLNVSYYWLVEACKTQSPSYVFLDVISLLRQLDTVDTSAMSKALLYMKPSIHKLKAIWNCKTPSQNVEEFLFPIIQFHTRWNELDKNDFSKTSESYFLKGAYISLSSNSYTDKTEINLDQIDSYQGIDSAYEYQRQEAVISNDAKEYFKRIVSFCKEHNIVLVPVKFPTMNWNKEKGNLVCNYLNSMDLKLLDLNNIDTLNLDWKIDTPDSGYHTNYWGATKTSHFLSSYILKETDLVSHVQEKRYSYWNEDLLEYQKWEENLLMSDELRAYQYLQKMVNYKENYYVIMSVRDEACANWNPLLQTAFESMGLKGGFYSNLQNSYIAVIDGGKVVFEQWAPAAMTLKTKFTSNENDSISTNIDVKSGGLVYGNESSIKINGQEYSLNNRGINIVILDRASNQVVSSISIDTHDPNLFFSENKLSAEQRKLWLERYPDKPLLSEGTYIITSQVNNECALKASRELHFENPKIVLWPKSNEMPQKFQLDYIGNGLYTLSSLDSGKYVSIGNGQKSAGANIVQTPPTNLASQKWFIVKNGHKAYTLISLYNGLSINVSGDVFSPGTNVQVDISRDAESQQFVFEKLD